MSTGPSSFGYLPRDRSGHPGERKRAPGPTAAALYVLSCLAEDGGIGGFGRHRDLGDLVEGTGLAQEDVGQQLARLIQYGYVEGTSGRRYRLATQRLGCFEITAASIRNSRTRSGGPMLGDGGDVSGYGESKTGSGSTNGGREERRESAMPSPLRMSRSLRFALAIPQLFSGERQELWIAEMADLVGLTHTTAHRYARSLVQFGVMEQRPSHKYSLTARAAILV